MNEAFYKIKSNVRLKELCLKGLKQRYGTANKAIKNRLKYELEVIRKANGEECLLLLTEIVSFAKKERILLGPGRSTNAGSLALYAIGATKVDPLRFGLFFESFLNPETLKFPLVTLDVEAGQEDKILNNIEYKYGKGKVFIAATYDKTKYSPKIIYIGLKVLALIAQIIKEVKKSKGIELSIDNIPLTDKKVYNLISSGDTEDVFQFTGVGMRKLLLKLQPKTIEDLSLAICFYRPGVMEVLPKLLKRRNGTVPIKYLHPKLEPILKGTYGFIGYREQVLQIAVQLAGFTLAQADELVTGLSKKNPEVIKKQKCLFVCGASLKGVKEKTAERIFKELELYTGYTSNRAHSISWAILAYQAAYLKKYYLEEYKSFYKGQ